MFDLPPLTRGALRARIARTPADRAEALALRGRVFRGGGNDRDEFDAGATHLLIEHAGRLRPIGCLRVMATPPGRARDSYSGRVYDLTALDRLAAPGLEVGRLCLAPEARAGPDALRLAFAILARAALSSGARVLFGCASFPGADPDRHLATLRGLRRHVAPTHLLPGPRAREVLHFAVPRPGEATGGARPASLPPLLRGYLAMGGRIGGHAVIDRDLDTTHVLTMLEPSALPAGRRRVLEAEAA